MYYGKGYGRYADDHDAVYSLLPNSLSQVLRKGGITDVRIYDYEHNVVGTNNANNVDEILQQFKNIRNRELPQNQLLEMTLICKKLIEQINCNKDNFTSDMYTIIMSELSNILKEINKSKGEIEI